MICLINPPNPPGTVSNKDTMGGFGQLYSADSPIKMPPIDLAYIAALLKKEEVEFKVFECLGLNWKLPHLSKNVKEAKPDLIGIRTSTPTFGWDLKVANLLKGESNSKIVLFGPHVGIYSNEAIDHSSVDGIILGEPEFTFLEVVIKGFDDTDGVWFKRDGKIVKNKNRGFIENLDSLPFPAWELLPYQEYDLGKYVRNIRPCATVLASRGCPFGCDYCPYPVSQGKKWRTRSISNVVDELEYLEKTLGIKAVLFRDPEFSLKRRRVIGICNTMIERRLGIKWRCETRIDTLDEELISLFAKAGCIGINIGIESVDAEVLKRMNRKTFSPNKTFRIMDVCKRNGIDVFVFFILGLPGETVESSLKTIKYAKRLNPSFVQFTAATPYKGTELYNWAKKNGYIEGLDMEQVTGFDVIMGNENITAEKLKDIVDYAHNYFTHTTIKDIVVKNLRLFSFLRAMKKTIALRKQEKDILLR